MEAVLLVGGHGSRLRPLTVTTPKPMLEMAGVPFLTHQLARARDAGVEHVVLATSYRPHVFRDYFGDGSAFGLELEYVTELEPLGTGGGIRHAAPSLTGTGPVLVFNGDVLTGLDIAGLVALHEAAGATVTLHLTEVADPRAFGVVPTDADGRVTAFLEKTPDPPTNRINAGCYVFSRDALMAIPTGRPVSVERETFPGLVSTGELVKGYVDDTYWLDVGTPTAFVRGSRDLVLGLAPSPAVISVDGDRLIGLGASVAEEAVVTGGSTVGAGARIDPGATVDGSVVFSGAVVEADAVVRDSVVGHRSVVGAGSVLVGATIGDDAHIGSGNELLSGVRLWPGVELPDCGIRFSSDS